MNKILLALSVISTLMLQPAYGATLPTSGTCGFLLTMPVPFAGANPNTGTGYNILGTITFNSATSATMSLYAANAAYGTAAAISNGSPVLVSPNIVNNLSVTITSMTTTTGFVGGYILSVTTPALTFNAVPTNGGNTILLQSASATTGPASGICQF